MRVAIVNDLPMAVEHLRRILARQPRYRLAWTAADGAQAVERCAWDRPDVILMDLFMPVMDGIEATRRIMQQSPCAILLVTAYSDSQVGKVFEGLGAGALDVVATPGGSPEDETRFLNKLQIIGKLVAPAPALSGPARREAEPGPLRPLEQLVAIGASTGGPKAVAAILARLPADLPAALVVVQHIDGQFAAGLIGWLQAQTRLPVSAVRNGDRPRRGAVLVAGGDQHLVLTRSGTLAYTAQPDSCPYRPSIDVFLNSLGQRWPAPAVAVLLTGMGSDGAKSLLELRQAGWHTIAQERSSCAVYGMPRAAIELGAAREILTPEQIAPAILRWIAKPPIGLDRV